MNGLLELFLPAPSLSTTSSRQTTLGRPALSLLVAPLRRSLPTSLSSPDEFAPSSRGLESWIVIVREPSEAAEVLGRVARYDIVGSDDIW